MVIQLANFINGLDLKRYKIDIHPMMPKTHACEMRNHDYFYLETHTRKNKTVR
jgi:hypothetical protein